eukprot:6212362-Pleurochrysis_carterae.AAC.5
MRRSACMDSGSLCSLRCATPRDVPFCGEQQLARHQLEKTQRCLALSTCQVKGCKVDRPDEWRCKSRLWTTVSPSRPAHRPGGRVDSQSLLRRRLDRE